mmetsp:Transcript_3286/g.7099  ORF Transcript_3286/g.7099 Transcript_3286/m.7099 type:complete len:238 (+) Transcript_3286:1905-2618(+)
MPDKPLLQILEIAAYFFGRGITEHLVFVVYGPFNTGLHLEGLVHEERNPRKFLARTGPPPRGNGHVRVGIFHGVHVIRDNVGVVGAVFSEIGDEFDGFRVDAPGLGIPRVVKHSPQRKLQGNRGWSSIVDSSGDTLHPDSCFAHHYREPPPIVNNQASSRIIGRVGRPDQFVGIVPQDEISVRLHRCGSTTFDVGVPNGHFVRRILQYKVTSVVQTDVVVVGRRRDKFSSWEVFEGI